ncbi:MAG: hypothetical protein ACM3Q1_08615 [Bacteroidales bacterium]
MAWRILVTGALAVVWPSAAWAMANPQALEQVRANAPLHLQIRVSDVDVPPGKDGVAHCTVTGTVAKVFRDRIGGYASRRAPVSFDMLCRVPVPQPEPVPGAPLQIFGNTAIVTEPMVAADKLRGPVIEAFFAPEGAAGGGALVLVDKGAAMDFLPAPTQTPSLGR